MSRKKGQPHQADRPGLEHAEVPEAVPWSHLHPFTLHLDLARGDCLVQAGQEELGQNLEAYVTQWWDRWKNTQIPPLADRALLLCGWVKCRRRGIDARDEQAVQTTLSAVLERAVRGETQQEEMGAEGCCLVWGCLTASVPPGRVAALEPAASGSAAANERSSREEEQPHADALATLARIGDAITAVQRPLVEQLQGFLHSLEGRSFGSFAVNQRVASLIQDVVSRLGMAFACPREDCGRPAKLRCVNPPRAEAGVFQFDHVVNGRRTSHGGFATLPGLRLVEALPDRRKKSNRDSSPA